MRLLRWIALSGLALLFSAPADAGPIGYVQHNLVSDIPGLADHTDSNLKNPWGISFPPTGPFWVSNQVTGVATLYNGAGQPFPVANPLVVTIPPAGSGNPTGQVFNGTTDFNLPTGAPARFIFATLNGTLAAWNGASGTTAQIVATASLANSVYTGLAIGNNGSGNFLYAANDSQGRIDVYNGAFAPTTLAGSFTDPNLPMGFTPYGIREIGGTIYVTYENEAQGGGVVNAFDLNGNFLHRISANSEGGPLDDPWGLALAPATFGDFAGKLLVGNEGDGRISAFDPVTGSFAGQLTNSDGTPIENPGLWGLTFGNGGIGGDPNTLYFAAGIQGEEHGLFGSLRPVPEPSSIVVASLGVLILLSRRWIARKRA